MWVRSPIRKTDWQFFDGPRTREAVRRLEKEGNRPSLSEKEAFELAGELFNRLDNKDTDPDSLRRWVQQQAAWFIERLNGNPPVSNYSGETFKILLRYFFNAEAPTSH